MVMIGDIKMGLLENLFEREKRKVKDTINKVKLVVIVGTLGIASTVVLCTVLWKGGVLENVKEYL